MNEVELFHLIISDKKKSRFHFVLDEMIQNNYFSDIQYMGPK